LGNIELDEETSHNAELTLAQVRPDAPPSSFSLFPANQVDDFIFAATRARHRGGFVTVEYRQQERRTHRRRG